ncbi:TIP-1 family-domain-containing protein [Glomus cerebriforme]|uniref:TIP-1 family-domain-containing protein n=1 Tax=Glomus cerebriforme TaxID=658196 RepID=A0A397TD14_9GLOM|nr:TIP-1 family-domain-containing protein [Glomus cerebriforme]
MPSTGPYDPEILIRDLDENTTENHVVDFLNSHFRELEDLEKLNSILVELKENEQSLNEKRVQTQEKTSKILQQTLVSFNSTVTELEKLQTTRKELEDTLTDHRNTIDSEKLINIQGIEGSENEPLMEKLAKLQQQVDSLERSKQYLKVLVIADELSTKAKQLIEKSPQKALVPYTQLAHLARNIKSNSKEAGHAVSHLDIYLQQCVDALWEDMKIKLTKKFKQTLDALNWPTPIKVPYPPNTTDKFSAFRKAFSELLLLQRPVDVDEALESKNPKEDNGTLPPLLPMQIMVEPLIVRFRYHFDSKRPTNRIDKPEWYFSHVITTIREHSPFLTGAVQAIVDDAGFEKYHAKNEFIRCLLVVVTRKLNNSVPTLLNSPQVFSHTVFETLQFDQTLRELHMYTPPGQTEWKGCVEVFTGKKEWFKAWLKVEKAFAEARYNEIMHSEDVWEMVDEEFPEDEYKPTKSAAKLINLLELVTNRYKLLPMFHNRIRFLVDIQADLLVAYSKRIDSAVDSFGNLSYSFVRAVPNVANTDITGVEGLKRLCRWLNSAGFISRTIKEWGEDSFFLELWHEVTVRAARNTGASPLPSPTSSISSTEQGHDASSTHEDGAITVDEGTVFDDPAELFDNACERIQSLIVKNVSREFFNGLKAYIKKNNWSSSDICNNDFTHQQIPKLNNQSEDTISRSVIELSPELYTPLSDLAHSLTFLSNNLPDRIFKYIYKDVSKELEDYLWDRILMRKHFSEMGGCQFEVDMEKGLFTIGKRWIRKPESYFRRLRDACILLTLPANNSKIESKSSDKKSQQKTLSQVVSMLSDDELEPKAIPRILENLGVYHLTPKEAIDVIERRVDL